MDYNSRFGRNMRQRRKVLHLTQGALARKANLNRAYINQIERGKKNITFSTATKIALALDSSISQLIKDCSAPENSTMQQS